MTRFERSDYKIIKIEKKEEIPSFIQSTPVEKLLLFHNCRLKQTSFTAPELLISTCMDHRIKLNIPVNFSYIMRSGGANFKGKEFYLSYAVAISKIKYVVIMGHSSCGMVDIEARKQAFIEGLVENGGWESSAALQHYEEFAPVFEIENEKAFVIEECQRLQKEYPKLMAIPAFYNLQDNLIYILDDRTEC